MKKGILTLIAVTVCALMPLAAVAQNLNSLPAEMAVEPAATVTSVPANAPALAVTDLRAKLNEAQERLKAQAGLGAATVVLAVLNPQTSQIDLVSVAKDSFLTKGVTLTATSQSGR